LAAITQAFGLLGLARPAHDPRAKRGPIKKPFLATNLVCG
jgi:hypothetical protein